MFEAGPDECFGSLDDLGCPSYSEILAESYEGEVQYFWQLQKDATHPEDNDWIVLPVCVGKVLDREYARWVTSSDNTKLQPVFTFGIHLALKSEISYGWQDKRTKALADQSRTLIKPQKNILMLNFNRRAVELKLDSGIWRKVRCVKVTHETPGEVVVEADLHDILKDRLHAYENSDDECAEKPAEEIVEQDEQAEQEGFVQEPILGDGFEEDVPMMQDDEAGQFPHTRLFHENIYIYIHICKYIYLFIDLHLYKYLLIYIQLFGSEHVLADVCHLSAPVGL